MLKSLSTWVISLVGLVVVAGVLSLLRTSYSTTGLISNENQTGTVQLGVDSDWSSWTSALTSFFIAAVVLLSVSVLATTIAVSVRKPIPTVLAVLVVVVAMFYLSSLPFSPSETIAAWLNFDSVNGGLVGDHLFWSYPGSDLALTDSTVSIPTPLLASIVLIAAAIGAGGFGVLGLNRRKSL